MLAALSRTESWVLILGLGLAIKGVSMLWLAHLERRDRMSDAWLERERRRQFGGRL